MLAGTADEIGEPSLDNRAPGAGCIIDADTDVETILSLAREAGQITRFSYEPPSLSDIFNEAVAS